MGLWKTLILEEYVELVTALAVEDLKDTADACTDLITVIIGLMNNLGLPFESLWKEVHRSNLSKIEKDIQKREDGKVIKPNTYTPPNIENIIKDPKHFLDI
jgi:predicted HAD superfamily Cof-like phosphohydrolase